MDEERRKERLITLIDSLQKARESKGMSQKEVADELGKHQTFVSKYENGEIKLDVIQFVEITEVLGIKLLPILRKVKNAGEV